jgi:flavin-dependent dehydrogenase
MSRMNALPSWQTPWNECEVIVLGGGPAGAAAAITLARAGRSVAVLEASRYDRDRIGETLPPAARSPLMQLAVWDQFITAGHAPSPGILSVWGEDELYENHFIFNPYGEGWHLDRQRFDAMLALAAEEAGALVCCGAQVTSCLELSSDRWQVEFISGGHRNYLRATFLIDATGRASWLARRQGAKRINMDRLVGVAGLLTANSRGSGSDYRTLVEATNDGWWYSALLPGSRMIAVYMTDADLLPRHRKLWPNFWHERLQQTTHTRARLRACDLQGALRVVAANSSRLDCVIGRRWLAAGDAALAFDPLSSQGILQSLATGIRAGDTLDSYLAGETAAMSEYAIRANDVFEEYARLHSVYYGREQRWPQSVFWQRRHAAVARSEDYEAQASRVTSKSTVYQAINSLKGRPI